MDYNEIAAIIYGSIFILFFIIACIFAGYYDLKKTEKRNEYIKTLDEHDKSVIMTYLAQKPELRKKKQK